MSRPLTMIPTREHKASASSIEWVVRMAPRVPCTFLLIVFLIVKIVTNNNGGDGGHHHYHSGRSRWSYTNTSYGMRSGAIRTTDTIAIVCIKLSWSSRTPPSRHQQSKHRGDPGEYLESKRVELYWRSAGIWIVKQKNFVHRRNTMLRACLHGGGGPQVGEVTRLGEVTRQSI